MLDFFDGERKPPGILQNIARLKSSDFVETLAIGELALGLRVA